MTLHVNICFVDNSFAGKLSDQIVCQFFLPFFTIFNLKMYIYYMAI